MQHVIQGAFQYDWIREAKEKEQNQRKLQMKQLAMPTKASQGHARGAQLYAQVSRPMLNLNEGLFDRCWTSQCMTETGICLK